MPELPEVETIKNAIKERISSKRIVQIEFFRKNLREYFDIEKIQNAHGSFVEKVYRKSKYMILDCSNGDSLIIHFGMSGTIRIENSFLKRKHDHFLIRFENCYLIYNDPRRFGYFGISETSELELHKKFKNLGPDAISSDFSYKFFFDKIKNRKKNIYSALMDSNLVAGIGNIYANEILYDVKISPLRSVSHLSQNDCELIVNSAKKILALAIKNGGSSINDYKKPSGKLGYFQNKHKVYGKGGELCLNCEKLIKMVKIGGRSVFYCAICQN